MYSSITRRDFLHAGAAVIGLAALPQALAVSPDELLEPEKAFRITARGLNEHTVEVQFRIADGYYMYRDRFSFATEGGQPLGEAEIPRGKIKEDQFFGRSEVFRDLVTIRVPLSAEDAAKGRVNLKVTSQGCSDKGVCYTPLEQTVRVNLSGTTNGSRSDLPAPAIGRSIPWLLLAVSFAGALVTGWASAGAPIARGTHMRIAVPQAVIWPTALAALGALAGWLGSRIAQPWFGAPLALAYIIAAALWMHWSMHRGESSRMACGVRDAILGAAVVLLAFHVGDPWFGASASLGAGLAIGTFIRGRTRAAHEPALQAVALAMVAAAVWVAGALLPDAVRMLAWASWLVMTGMLLRAIDPLPERAHWFARLAKAAGVGVLVSGIAVAIGALSGARDPLRPLEALRSGSATRPIETPVRFERVKTLSELEARIASAGRPVMLDFYADWCVSCKEMEQFTFSQAAVRDRMHRMLLLQVDVTASTMDDMAILKRFRLFGPPGIIFFDGAGRELPQRVIGYQPPERFLRVLDSVLGQGGAS